MTGRNSSILLVALLVFLLGVACAHTETTGKNEENPVTEQGASADVRARKVTPTTPPGHPPLAASPSQLLKPGAREKIAQALNAKGFVSSENAKGEELTAGIRKFQERQGLAATGFPDHETVARLGIDPREVDKSLENFSGSKPGEAQADVGNGKAAQKKEPAKSGSGNDSPPSDDASRSADR